MTERPRRSRRLSESEIELWLSVARTVVARQGAVLPQPKPAPPPPPPPSLAAVPAAPPPMAAPAQRASNARPAPPPLAPFEKRYRRQVARGQVAIDAAIDLHGLNQAEAHHALHSFLRSAQQQGGRLVLVVTGKGRARISLSPGMTEREPGVLRRAVPAWLREEALRGVVLGFEEAGLPHGGMGALYIRLRKRSA